MQRPRNLREAEAYVGTTVQKAFTQGVFKGSVIEAVWDELALADGTPLGVGPLFTVK